MLSKPSFGPPQYQTMMLMMVIHGILRSVHADSSGFTNLYGYKRVGRIAGDRDDFRQTRRREPGVSQ